MEQKAIQTTVKFLKSVLYAADIKGSRYYIDIFTDRLSRASCSASLELAIETLIRLLNCSSERLWSPNVVEMMQLCSSQDAPRVLKWLRQQTRLVAMLTVCKDENLVKETIEGIELPLAIDDSEAIASRRGEFDITLNVKCESPLSHGADEKAGNATLFRRMQVVATNGSMLYLPYYSGNAIRGQLRDLLADHFLSSLGIFPDRARPRIALWFFYALYSGGALEENSEASKALKKELGIDGSLRTDGIRKFRSLLPNLSLLGCALGNRILPGRCQVADLRPVCREWGTGDIPVAELLSWEYLTRREDHEDHEEHHGMIANTEVLKAGVELEGGIDIDRSISELERSALGRGLLLLQDRGLLGAQNRRGLGRVTIQILDAPNPEPYDKFLADRKEDIISYLRDLKVIEDTLL